MKFMETTYGEFQKKYGGLNRLRFDRKDMVFRRGFLVSEVRVAFMYYRKKDCTYVAFTPSQLLGITEPKSDYLTIIFRYDGKIDDDTYNEEYHEDLTIAFEECEMWFNENVKEEES